MPLIKGQLLHGRYEIQASLGQGGMGAVYRAHDQVLDHPCAVKELVPPPGLSASQVDGLRQQFRQEAKILANLDHPSLPHVIDYFSEKASEYLVMDLVEGASLDKLIEKAGKRGIEEERVLDWATQLLEALAHCHSHGVIHRDVKPANILIRSDTAQGPSGRAVLVDFGLVKQWDPQDPGTRTAMRGLGTPEYAPPEQYYGASGHTDPRSDIYSLGATLYHALTGQAPPTATMRMATPGQFQAPRSVRQDVSARTEAVILRAMELPLDQRFKSAEQMASSLLGTALLPGSRRPKPTKAGGRVATKMGKGVLRVSWGLARLLLRVLVVLLIVTLLLGVAAAVGGAYALSALAERALPAYDWGLEKFTAYDQLLTISQAELDEAARLAVEPYALDMVDNVAFQLRPPESVEVSADVFGVRLYLRGRLVLQDGVLCLYLERLNDVPLYVVGGIISGGINRGLDETFAPTSFRLDRLEVQASQIVAQVEGGRSVVTWPSPTLTPRVEPTATAIPRPTSTPKVDPTATTIPRPTSTPLSPTAPAPTTSPSPTKLPSPTKIQATTEPGVITNFESFGTWRRGDEPNGMLSQSKAQVHQGSYAAALNYQFNTSGNDYVVFAQSHSLAGQPKWITAWVYGDGAGHFLNIWIKDSGGQVWQVPLGRITHTGWQQMSGAIETGQAWPWTHISGTDNGRVDYPLSFQALIVDDNPDSFRGAGAIYLDDLRADAETAPTAEPSGGGAKATAAATAPPSSGALSGRIAFTIYNAGIGSYTLYTLDLSGGGGPHPVANYAHQPDFSPDGRRIAVDGVGGGKNDLWHFKFDGTDWQQMTTSPDDHFPTWSKNGKLVAFSSLRQGDGVYRLYLWDTSGDYPLSTGTTELTIGDYPVQMPNWEIVFNGCDYGWGPGTRCGLWRMSKGRMPASLTDNPQDVPSDGSTDDVLFLRPEDNNWEIYRIGATGGNPIRLTDSPGRDGPAAFSPDGKTIAFLSERSGTWALYTMDRQGGNVKKLLDLPQGGNFDAGPYPWQGERLSWGTLPSAPAPKPTEDDGLLPAPIITLPLNDSTVATHVPTLIQWTWSGQLAFNQGFQVRFWHTSSNTPAGITPAIGEKQIEVNLGDTDAYRLKGESHYYLDVVVVQLNPYKVLSQSSKIRIRVVP